MSSDYTIEDIELMSRATKAAMLIFPDKHKGKFFREAAKRLARSTGIAYEDALKRLNAAAVGAAIAVAEERMKEVQDG